MAGDVATGAAVGAAGGAAVGAVVPGVSVIEGAAVGAAIGGLAGAVWIDTNNDGYVDGYMYNGQYYTGTPQGYDPATHTVANGALGGAALGAAAGAVIPGVSVLQGAVIGRAVGGIAGAVWADRNNDGRVDGYVYNGQYYAGSPVGTNSSTRPSTGVGSRSKCGGMPPLTLSPPQPSTPPLTLDNRFFSSRGASLRSVADELTKALRTAGYEDQSFYCIPGGFALATAIERIQPDNKVPWPGDARWDLARIPILNLADGFSPTALLHAFIHADAGSYRMIVFYVTDGTVTPSQIKPGQDFRRLPKGGPDEAPNALISTPYTTQHRVIALLYEFRRESVASPVSFLESTLPTALQLRRAGIIRGLQR